MEKIFLFLCIAAVLGVQLCFGNPLELEVNEGPSRIVNGIVAAENQFPYAVSLQRISALSQATRGHTCGGSLITLAHVVTSGYCLFELAANGTFVLKQPGNYRVFGGSNLLNNDTSADRWRGVSAFTPNPNYIPPNNNNDIGVITLTSAFRSVPGIAPLAISNNAPSDAALCTVPGWGSTMAGGSASPSLLYTNRYTVPQSACSMMSAATGGPSIQPHMLCAQFSTGFTPSCTNDTGNPMVCNNVLVGVLSWYNACSLQHNYEVYTRTANFQQWLRTVSAAPPAASAIVFPLFVAAALTYVLNYNKSL